MARRTQSSLITIMLLLFLAACSSSKKLTAPATAIAVADTLPSLPASEIDIPVKIAGKPILALMDSILPKEFISPGWPAFLQTSCELRYKWRFVRNSFSIACVDNHFSLQMKAAYQVAGSRCLCAMGKPVSPWINGNCGFVNEPMRKVDIGISTAFSFQPDYRIRTQSRLDQLSSKDKCVMSMFSMDMTGMILDSIRSSINGFCKTLDETVAGLNFTNYARQTGARAWQKTPIGPYGYLVINPTAIRIGNLNYVKDTFNINLGISCRPALLSDSDNKDLHTPVLPPLGSAAGNNGLAIYLPVKFDYDFLSKMANDSLRDRSFQVKGRTVIVKEVAFKGMGHHQVEIRIDFAGSKKGRIYLRGTPVLDTAKQSLDVPDIAYTLESRDLVIKMARSLFRNKIRKSLKGNSYLDLAALLKTHLPMLDAQLNRRIAPNLFAKGNIKECKMIGLLATQHSLQAHIMLKANLSVTSTGLPY